MGICQSSALKVTVFDPASRKHIYYFSMKKLKTFQSLGDVLNLVSVELTPRDKIYCQTNIGPQELFTHSRFQIQDLVVKTGQRELKYRIQMESMY